jgi:hypothetical protein
MERITDDLTSLAAAINNDLLLYRNRLPTLTPHDVANLLPYIEKKRMVLSRTQIEQGDYETLTLLVKHGLFQVPSNEQGARPIVKKRMMELQEQEQAVEITYQCWDQVLEFISYLEENRAHVSYPTHIVLDEVFLTVDLEWRRYPDPSDVDLSHSSPEEKLTFESITHPSQTVAIYFHCLDGQSVVELAVWGPNGRKRLEYCFEYDGRKTYKTLSKRLSKFI